MASHAFGVLLPLAQAGGPASGIQPAWLLILAAAAVAVLFLLLVAARSPLRMVFATLAVAALCGGLLLTFTITRVANSTRRINQVTSSQAPRTTVQVPPSPGAPAAPRLSSLPSPVPGPGGELVPVVAEVAIQKLGESLQKINDLRRDLQKELQDVDKWMAHLDNEDWLKQQMAQDAKPWEGLARIMTELARKRVEQSGGAAKLEPFFEEGDPPAPVAAVRPALPPAPKSAKDIMVFNAPALSVKDGEFVMRPGADKKTKNSRNTGRDGRNNDRDTSGGSVIVSWLRIPILVALLIGTYGVLKANTRRARPAVSEGPPPVA